MKLPIQRTLITLLLASAAPAFGAADWNDRPPDRSDFAYENALAAAKSKDFTRAASILREAIVQNPRNADYHNLYAYSIRMGHNPEMNLVFRHYNEALRLSPDHRGAHEYIGEAYLMVDNLPKAKEHLSVLNGLCRRGCDELKKLQKAISDFEAKQSQK